jgi:hypothetical protein
MATRVIGATMMIVVVNGTGRTGRVGEHQVRRGRRASARGEHRQGRTGSGAGAQGARDWVMAGEAVTGERRGERWRGDVGGRVPTI